jgi:hypothetical protein
MFTSPTAKNLPSGLIETHVAAFIRSRAVHVFDVGESDQSFDEVVGDCPTPNSLSDEAIRLRVSFEVVEGVEGALKADESVVYIGCAVGRARKKYCVVWRSLSILTTTAAAPAVYANKFEDGRLSKPLAELVVVPMICLSERPASYEVRPILLGERIGFCDCLKKGELDGVSFSPRPGFAGFNFALGV